DGSRPHPGRPGSALPRPALRRPVALSSCGRETHEGVADGAPAALEVALRDDRRRPHGVEPRAAASPGRGAARDARPAPSGRLRARRLGRDRALAARRAFLGIEALGHDLGVRHLLAEGGSPLGPPLLQAYGNAGTQATGVYWLYLAAFAVVFFRRRLAHARPPFTSAL